MRDKTGRTLFQLMDRMPYVFWVFDPRNVEIVYINRAYESMWGRSCSSLYRRPLSFLEAVHPEDLARAHEMLKKQLLCQSTVEQFRIVTGDGKVRRVRDSSWPIEIEPRGTVYIVGTVEDITDSYRARKRVKRPPNKKVEQLAGGIAHDFNNVLTAVMCNGDFLLKDQSLSNEAQRRTNAILEAAKIGKNLAKELTDISRRAAAKFVDLDLSKLILGLADSLKCLVGTEIELTTALAPKLVSIRANPEQLSRVLMNLALNAHDAMPSGGSITISTYNTKEPRLANGTKTLFPCSKKYAALEVADTGCGMDSTTQAHIFEPFFTTKSCRVGTGLGLYHAKRIVHECHGQICVSSAVGMGTTFYLYFPKATKATVGVLKDTNTLTVVTPATSAGPQQIVLTNSDGESVSRDAGFLAN